MRRTRVWGWFVVALMLIGTTACGSGGGGGGDSSYVPLTITSTALPATLSGQVVNHPIPFTGGSGGPFILEVIEGDLPPGVAVDNTTVALEGRVLEDGVYDFRLKLTDTGSQPFGTTVREFHWEIGIGALVFDTGADLPDIVFNQFSSIPLVVAGGVPPYMCEVADDPNNPNDEDLPLGMAIPPDSCTIVGAPQEAKSGGAPFFVTIRARDHADDPSFPNPLTVTRTFEITILVPPIVIATSSLPDGKCGTAYNERVEISDGVPPFKHNLVTDVNETTRRMGEPASPGGVAKGSATSAYALETDAGPNYTKRFPEGVLIDDDTGQLTGIPRRRGTFLDWTYYVYSTLLPAEPSQNQWRNFTFSMAQATPPPMVLDPAVLAAGSTSFSPPNNKIPELEVGKPYSLQFKALGGVAMDGLLDAPHESQALADPNETQGNYGFSASFPSGVPPGMSFTTTGLFSGTPTTRHGFRTINLVATDEQLPTSIPLGFPNTASGSVQFSSGPDSVVITETLSGTTSTSFDDIAYEFGDQTVEIFEPFTGTPTVRPLNGTDFTAAHSHPLSGGTLAGSLSNIDLINTSVNPTWWAYDVANLNAKGARAGQHGEWQRRYPADTVYSDFFRRFIGGGGSMPLTGSDHSPNLSVELPELAAGVVVSPASNPGVNGVYRDGGQLFGYDRTDEFGFFIVRKDAKFEIPVAFKKPAGGGTYTGFGDGWVSASVTAPGAIRRPQITVSPDGRFAAAKLKVDVTNFQEAASSSAIVIFSLTGEKPFAGGTSSFKVIGTGSGGTSASGGTYLYGDTLTLTNRHLYYMTGDYEGQSNGNLVIYSRHYVYRYEIASAASAGALLSGGAISSSIWSNTAAAPLAMPYHKWMTPGAASIASQGLSYGITPYATSYGNAGINPHFFTYNYANFSENSMAPHPLRVSAAGNAVAIVAAPDSASAVTGVNFMKYFAFVDYDTGSGTPLLREITGGTSRRFGSGSRLGGFAPGEDLASFYSSQTTDRFYGWYDGPASQLEISDNGLKVALVYNESTSSWLLDGKGHEVSGRENLLAFSATGAATDPWSSLTTRAVTGAVFVSPTYWRFGALHFTRDNNGIVFWGGYSNYDGNTTGYHYQWPGILTGTMYGCDLNIATTTVVSLLSSTDGGGNAGIATYTSSSPVNLTAFTSFSGEQGAISPMGAFVSNDGRFYYLRNWCSLNSSDGLYTMNRIVGINVNATSGAAINGRTAFRGFAPTMGTRYGWGMEGYYGLYGGMTRWHRGLGGALSLAGRQVSAARTGLVFFASYNQQYYSADYPYAGYDPNNTTYYYPSGAHPSAYGDYGGYGGEVYAFDANVGGNCVKLSSFGTANQYRIISNMQPTADGTRLAVTFSLPTPSPYDNRPHVEKLANFTGLTSSASGVISMTGSMNVEDTSGRVSASVAHDFLGSKLYYGFTTSSNENNMLLIEKTLNPTGSAVSATRTQGGALGGSGGQARFAVLHVGR